MSAPDFRPANFRNLTPRPILAAREAARALAAALDVLADPELTPEGLALAGGWSEEGQR